MDVKGEKFLNKIYSDLQHSIEVKRANIWASTKVKNKDEAVKIYMDRLERTHSEKHLEYIKHLYHERYAITEEKIKEKYYEFLDKQYWEQTGEHLTEELRKEHVNIIINDQKNSLNNWIEYFTSEDSSYCPMWAKYWAFQGMLKIGSYNQRTGTYQTRKKDSIAPFIELDREIFAKCIDLVIKKVNNEQIVKADLARLVNSGNFMKLYTLFINRKKEQLYNPEEIEGTWVKYNQGSDYQILYNSLQEYHTGWCTAGGEDTCKSQMASGDFYVYYTKNTNGEYVVPRLAIRMDGTNRIGEIRGVAKNQNVESYLEETLEQKLEEFPDKEHYQMRIHDSKMLTEIYRKENLTKEEIRFLYEVDREIEGFGYQDDPRIKEIRSKRNIKKDLSFVFDCQEEEIGTSEEDFNYSQENNIRLKYYRGDLYLDDLANAKGLILPSNIGGDLDLSGLTSAKGLILPSYIGEDLILEGLTSTEGLNLPEQVGGDLDLSGLISAEGLILPEQVGGDLDLSGLISAEGLILPEQVGGDLDLSRLTSAEGLNLPEQVGGDLDLRGLTSAEGLKFPERIGGTLDVRGLTSAEGLNLPEQVGEYLDLRGLTSAEGLKFPEQVGGDLYLSRLTSAEGLNLPKYIGRYLDLSGLTSIEGLILPENFDLDRLMIREDLKKELTEKLEFKVKKLRYV